MQRRRARAADRPTTRRSSGARRRRRRGSEEACQSEAAPDDDRYGSKGRTARAAVLEALTRDCDSYQTAAAIADELGLTHRAANRALTELKSAGEVKQGTRGHYRLC